MVVNIDTSQLAMRLLQVPLLSVLRLLLLIQKSYTRYIFVPKILVLAKFYGNWGSGEIYISHS